MNRYTFQYRFAPDVVETPVRYFVVFAPDIMTATAEFNDYAPMAELLDLEIKAENAGVVDMPASV